MMNFVKKLEFSDQKYNTYVHLRDENCKGKLLSSMKDYLSFGTDHQSICFMATRFLKDKINGVCTGGGVHMAGGGPHPER